jgi:hypothetical protein
MAELLDPPSPVFQHRTQAEVHIYSYIKDTFCCNSCTFQHKEINTLVTAGGGAAGMDNSGGGGAGGVLQTNCISVTGGSSLGAVVIGAGAARNPAPGSAVELMEIIQLYIGCTTYTAVGGGGGGQAAAGRAGGSGGGADAGNSGGAGTCSQGNVGGISSPDLGGDAGAGGGGAAAGGCATGNTGTPGGPRVAGAGGAGLCISSLFQDHL